MPPRTATTSSFPTALLDKQILVLSMLFVFFAFFGHVDVQAESFASFGSDMEGRGHQRPNQFHDFCGPRDTATGLASCEGSSQQHQPHEKDVATTVHLSWHMKVDPERILSLNAASAEETQSPRIVRCMPGEIELELPNAYARRLREKSLWTDMLVVASNLAHNCAHLGSRHLHARVVGVRRLTEHGTRARVHLSCRELPSLAHAIPYIALNLSYMPAEALDRKLFPVARNRSSVPRRVAASATPTMTDFVSEDGVDGDLFSALIDSGGLTTAGHSSTDVRGGVGDRLKAVPEQISNFGWNWDLRFNVSEDPEINCSAPGVEGVVKLRRPYLQLHAGVYLNFTSRLASMLEPPHVVWKAGLMGNGKVSARMLVDLRTTAPIEKVDPFHVFEIPLPEQLQVTRWLERIDVAVGNLPLSLEPGIQLKAELYHRGHINGIFQFGGQTHFVVNPEASFDSSVGFSSNVRARFEEVKIWPPLWIAAAQRFEMGIRFRPTIWLRGELLDGAKESQVGFEFEPYLNLTVTRLGRSSSVEGGPMESLVVYPLRVWGLEGGEPQKRYRVRLTVNGREVATSHEMNWGQVEFYDGVAKFDFGVVTRSALLLMPINVEVLETFSGEGFAETVLGSTVIMCISILNGECQPSPALAKFAVLGRIISVEIVMIWRSDAASVFASRLRGISLSFPRVSILDGDLQASLRAAENAREIPSPLAMRLVHADRAYLVPLGGVPLAGKLILELGPMFLDAWRGPCDEAACSSGRLELLVGQHIVAAGDLPELYGSGVAETATIEAAFGGADRGDHGPDFEITMQQTFLAAMRASLNRTGHDLTTTGLRRSIPTEPLTIALRPLTLDSSVTPASAFVELRASLTNPSRASAFFGASRSRHVLLESSLKLAWTVSGVAADSEVSFQLSAWKESKSSNMPRASHVGKTLMGIGSADLLPIDGMREAFTRRCEKAEASSSCIFSYSLAITSETFKVGDRAVVSLEWTDGDGQTHFMLSPPFDVAAEKPARATSEGDSNFVLGLMSGLAGEAREAIDVAKRWTGLGSELSSRRLWSLDDWGQRFAESVDTCKEKDLHLDIGAGMLTRARLANTDGDHGESAKRIASLLGSAGLVGVASLNTAYESIGEESLLDKDAVHILPEFLCANGVCRARLPGCSDNTQQMYYPTLVFNFNRDFRFKDRKAGANMVQTAMAYAFAVFPEAIELTMHELNDTTEKAVDDSASNTLNVPMRSGSGVRSSGADEVDVALPSDVSAMLAKANAFGKSGLTGASLSAAVGAPATPPPDFAAAAAALAAAPSPPLMWDPSQYPTRPKAKVSAAVQSMLLNAVERRRLESMHGHAAGVTDIGVLDAIPQERSSTSAERSEMAIRRTALPVMADRAAVAASPSPMRALQDDSPVQGRRVSVHFPGGLRFRVDAAFLETMRRLGMFQEVDDDLTNESGPLVVTEVSVHQYDDDAAKHGRVMNDRELSDSARVWLALLVCVLVLAIALAGANTAGQQLLPTIRAESPNNKCIEVSEHSDDLEPLLMRVPSLYPANPLQPNVTTTPCASVDLGSVSTAGTLSASSQAVPADTASAIPAIAASPPTQLMLATGSIAGISSASSQAVPADTASAIPAIAASSPTQLMLAVGATSATEVRTVELKVREARPNEDLIVVA
eukprot:TRINITY_DN1149_c0_g1_i1.p1 TRINITY_DN1149_c0_g1~~TRINITY_DN1149_c0_g1_i1.p1  ORF type:complete len:1655 (-),score=281.94 TRINITY_DN1149_c0_g1_i1:364-5328(-)